MHLSRQKETKEAFDRVAVSYPYTVSDLRNPRLLHRCMKRVRIALGTSTEIKDGRILDVGCGTGYFTIQLSKLYGQVVGIDLSKKMIKIAKISLKYERMREKIELVLADGEYMPVRSNTFDTVLCLDFLHHVSSVPSVVKEMVRVTVLGGKIVAVEPNYLNPLYAILCLFAKQESLKKFFVTSRRELSRLFKGVNMDNVSSKEVDYYPQLLLKLDRFPGNLYRSIDYVEELLRRQSAFSFLCSHFVIMGRKRLNRRLNSLILTSSKCAAVVMDDSKQDLET